MPDLDAILLTSWIETIESCLRSGSSAGMLDYIQVGEMEVRTYFAAPRTLTDILADEFMSKKLGG